MGDGPTMRESSFRSVWTCIHNVRDDAEMLHRGMLVVVLSSWRLLDMLEGLVQPSLELTEWTCVGPWLIIMRNWYCYLGLNSQILLCHYGRIVLLRFIMWLWLLSLLNLLFNIRTTVKLSMSFVLLAFTRNALKRSPHTRCLLRNFFFTTFSCMISREYFFKQRGPQ
jgi:hypothetical protein